MGLEINENGNLEIYTKAVDVAKISSLIKIGAGSDECKQNTYYNIVDATWENMQQEIKEWIENANEGQGQANIVSKTVVKLYRDRIEALLEIQETILEVNCN
jgi:hypothetical protein